MNEKTNGKILIISHQERILNIADRIIMMQDGKVVRDGKPDESCHTSSAAAAPRSWTSSPSKEDHNNG